MKYLYLEMRAEEPLAIRADHAANGAKTTKLLTGSAVLGSLAALHRQRYSEQRTDFTDLFLKDQVYFPQLLPASYSVSKRWLKPFLDKNRFFMPVLPVPRTAQSCKRFGGFYKLDQEGFNVPERHGVRDTLLDWAAFYLLQQKGSIPAEKCIVPLEGEKQRKKQCYYKGCEESLDHFTGYYRRHRGDSKLRTAMEVKSSLELHTGINREQGTVEDGILYSREVIARDSLFSGIIKVPDHLEGQLLQFHDERTYIGTGRTRGLGKVRIVVSRTDDSDYGLMYGEQEQALKSFKERLNKFDDTLRKVCNAYEAETRAAFYFALTLHAPAILFDDYLRYRGSIDAATLAELTGIEPKTFELLYQNAGVQRIAGWNELWGTPRQQDYAIETGSVFLFSSQQKLDDDDQLLQALYRLEEEGIGQRRAEGFGRVCVSDPFHLEREQM